MSKLRRMIWIFNISRNSLCWLWNKKNKKIQIGYLALILLTLQHFSLRQWLFSFLPPDFLPHFYFIFVPLFFSLNFISPNHLILAQIHCRNLSPNLSSSSIIPSSTPTSVALRADHSWIFEVSRFSNIALISLLILVFCLLFPCWSPEALPSVQTVVGYLRLVGSLNLALDLLNPIFCLILIRMRRGILVFC